MFRRWRRDRLRRSPFPAEWLGIVERNAPFWRLLGEEDRRELLGHAMVLLAEKRFEGAGGLEMGDEVRVTVSAWAALLLLHRRTGYFPGLYSVVVYPGAYLDEKVRRVAEDGLVVEGSEERAGESWGHGTVVLSWEEVREDALQEDERSVVLHEFAHQLDEEDGRGDGVPPLPERAMYAEWSRVLGEEYRALRRATRFRRGTVLDRYGAESPAEFFAVATEHFFRLPLELAEAHPGLYGLLSRYYRQDPASWPGLSRAAAGDGREGGTP